MLIKFNPDGVPEGLKQYSNFVLWKLRKVPGRDKPTKVPFQVNGYEAKTNVPATWTTLDNAVEAYKKGGFDGVGVVPNTDMGTYLSIDIDNVRCPAFPDIEIIAPWARRIVDQLDTYTEVTPSGRGLRLFVYGDIPDDGRNNRLSQYGDKCRKDAIPGIEMYKNKHYMTVTGAHLPESSHKVENRPQQVLQIYQEYFGGNEGKNENKQAQVGYQEHRNDVGVEATSSTVLTKLQDAVNAANDLIDDDDLLRLSIANNVSTGKHFEKLHGGDHSAYPSQSEADMAYCGWLAYLMACDAARMDRMVRKSGLMRPKWDEKHSSSGLTYGRMTINKAIAGCKKVFDLMTANDVDLDGYIDKMGQSSSRTDDTKQNVDEAVDSINQNYALVTHGTQVLVMNEFKRVSGQDDIRFMTVKDFLLLHRNKRVPIIVNGNIRQVNSGDLWLDSSKRREYYSAVFEPGTNDIPGVYNFYKGLGCKEHQGQWDLMQQHILDIICSGDKEVFEYLINWMADKVQHPGGKKHGVVIVLEGPPGAGKGLFATNYGQLFGQHFIHLIDSGLMTGRFNGHFKMALVVFVDESFFAGDKKVVGKLKGMITEKNFVVEEKFKDALTVTNHCNYIFASNENWVVPASPGERRYCCLRVSDKQIGNTAYFGAIQKQMRNGGREAMLFDLMHRDLTGIDLRKFPKKEALFDQILRSLSPTQLFWFESLRAGSFSVVTYHDDADTVKWPDEMNTHSLYQMFMNFDQFNKYRPCESIFGKELRKMCPGLSRKQKANRARYYFIPSLEVCRMNFEEFIKMKVDWQNEE